MRAPDVSWFVIVVVTLATVLVPVSRQGCRETRCTKRFSLFITHHFVRPNVSWFVVVIVDMIATVLVQVSGQGHRQKRKTKMAIGNTMHYNFYSYTFKCKHTHYYKTIAR